MNEIGPMKITRGVKVSLITLRLYLCLIIGLVFYRVFTMTIGK
jgi:hypothetical protein